MSNTKIISELIDQFLHYEQEVKTPTVSGFAAWVQKQTHTLEMSAQLKMGTADKHASQRVNETDNAIGILLAMMNKYARLYSKIVMESLPLNTVEEFGYLAHLSSHGQITKTTLINKSMDGKTTGMDIIRRLVQHGLAKEINNPEDKRSKLLRITEKGKKIIGQSYSRMAAVSKAVVGNLTIHEKQNLLSILNKLAQYHQQHEHEIGESLKRM
jgi:DNA-binding MarR family transcriptional regulator